jgi:hypothetical protein
VRVDDWVEWHVSSRPATGEAVSGDVHVAAPCDSGLLLAAIDGLGHGEGAAQAAERARDVLLRAPEDPLDELVKRCHMELRGMRGVALAVAFMEKAGRLRWLGVGNVEAVVVRAARNARPGRLSLMLLAGVVGQQIPSLRLSETDLSPCDVLVLATDGVRSAFIDTLSAADPPSRTAQGVLEAFGKKIDDALVLAAVFIGVR